MRFSTTILRLCRAIVVSYCCFPLSHALADECLTSTTLPPRLAHYPNIKKAVDNEEAGYFLASLENGDQLLVNYSRCSLSLQGHLFIQERIPLNELLVRYKTFMQHLTPANDSLRETQLQQAQKTLSSITTIDQLKKEIIIDGLGDRHSWKMSDSISTLYAYAFHYEWLPPEH